MADAKEIQEFADTRGLSYADAMLVWERIVACTVSGGDERNES
jgi:hypothetical protein